MDHLGAAFMNSSAGSTCFRFSNFYTVNRTHSTTLNDRCNRFYGFHGRAKVYHQFMTVRMSDPDPSGVPLVIEPDWEPSLDKPLPQMRCVAVTDSDTLERCGRWSVRGLSTCINHSGYEEFPSVRVYADTVIESARLRLMGMTDIALDALLDLLGPDTRQNVRLRAAEVVLDRSGVVKPPEKQEVEVTVRTSDPAAILAERLNRLSAAQLPMSDDGDDEGEVVQGEIIDN
jgi:hypothetical protein